jgi:hypothetical protein
MSNPECDHTCRHGPPTPHSPASKSRSATLVFHCSSSGLPSCGPSNVWRAFAADTRVTLHIDLPSKRTTAGIPPDSRKLSRFGFMEYVGRHICPTATIALAVGLFQSTISILPSTSASTMPLAAESSVSLTAYSACSRQTAIERNYYICSSHLGLTRRHVCNGVRPQVTDMMYKSSQEMYFVKVKAHIPLLSGAWEANGYLTSCTRYILQPRTGPVHKDHAFRLPEYSSSIIFPYSNLLTHVMPKNPNFCWFPRNAVGNSGTAPRPSTD